MQLLLGACHAHKQQPHLLIVTFQRSRVSNIPLQSSMRNQGVFTTCQDEGKFDFSTLSNHHSSLKKVRAHCFNALIARTQQSSPRVTVKAVAVLTAERGLSRTSDVISKFMNPADECYINGIVAVRQNSRMQHWKQMLHSRQTNLTSCLPTMKTTGNSRPLDKCNVMTLTLSGLRSWSPSAAAFSGSLHRSTCSRKSRTLPRPSLGSCQQLSPVVELL